MKTLTIKYSIDPAYNSDYPYWATAYDNDLSIQSACGETFTDAKKRLLEKLRVQINHDPIPNPETIEL